LAAEVRGLDTVSGIPRKATVTSEEIREALTIPLGAIIDCCRSVIEKCDPELVSDLADTGLTLTGGGALIRGLDDLMREQLGIPIQIADDPLTTVARGTAVCLEHLEQWRESLEAEGNG
jgi:rod shape-determining protein MreB